MPAKEKEDGALNLDIEATDGDQSVLESNQAEQESTGQPPDRKQALTEDWLLTDQGPSTVQDALQVAQLAK
jgi:hypothetical protein